MSTIFGTYFESHATAKDPSTGNPEDPATWHPVIVNLPCIFTGQVVKGEDSLIVFGLGAAGKGTSSTAHAATVSAKKGTRAGQWEPDAAAAETPDVTGELKALKEADAEQVEYAKSLAGRVTRLEGVQPAAPKPASKG